MCVYISLVDVLLNGWHALAIIGTLKIRNA